jgi:hypothetical protein
MVLAALVSSLALMAAGPADAPMATRAGNATLDANAEALAKGEAPFPAGAPTDDYGFLGWCYGALSGHVDLYGQVLGQVRRIEGEFPVKGETLDSTMAEYQSQHALGEKLLASYSAALDSHKPGKVSRDRAVAMGHEVWKGSASADPKELAQTWMSWALPARCQTTARKLGAKLP